MLERLRERVCRVNKELERAGLVVLTSSTVSGREAGTDRVVIKPSGVPYEKLSQEHMVVVSLEGQVLEGRLKPSLDMPTHLYIYRHRPEVNGIAHTHSPFASAFAAAGRPLPVVLLTIAEHFGGPIPIGEYASTEGEEIGKEIMRSVGRAKAILMKHHGLYAFGETPEIAFRNAAIIEGAARTSCFALLLGPLSEVPPEEVARVYRRYQEEHGQDEQPE